MSSMPDGSPDDLLAKPYLCELGWELETITWQSENVNWDHFDLVVVRSTWDYHLNYDSFIQVIEQVANSKTVLANVPELIKWNSRKSYLKDLHSAGIPTVPSHFGDELREVDIATAFEEFQCATLVLKPSISADGYQTRLLKRDDPAQALVEIVATFDGAEYMLQPFISSIQRDGEYSIMILNGSISHCVLKSPASGDFRTQERFGGSVKPAPIPAKLQALAARILDYVKPVPLYARVDLLLDSSTNEGVIMELELIEPSLWLSSDVNAAARFATAIHSYYLGRVDN